MDSRTMEGFRASGVTRAREPDRGGSCRRLLGVAYAPYLGYSLMPWFEALDQPGATQM
ncbi:MAG: hypothetical protein KA191_05950 [Verrucomicrobia bacterium]|nr:hypothetical protein [Verrucomicrobiota bacterium]MDI9379268.1 hypothetical protein [Verrucomicrobiota bacterium]NMD19410.1 hypothetical protein [Verrucomicrobiota bacterium]HNU99860.1 hypothetical protein [Verrucomicrobiota bacterium]HOA62450.1 hypothetical protein [Verrucomicrobiota bacterium]